MIGNDVFQNAVKQLLQQEADNAEIPVVVLVVDETHKNLIDMRVQPMSEMAALISLTLDQKLEQKNL